MITTRGRCLTTAPTETYVKYYRNVPFLSDVYHIHIHICLTVRNYKWAYFSIFPRGQIKSTIQALHMSTLCGADSSHSCLGVCHGLHPLDMDTFCNRRCKEHKESLHKRLKGCILTSQLRLFENVFF